MSKPSDVDGFFIHVIEYARQLQPCVVLLDRCDVWFSGDVVNKESGHIMSPGGWRPRGQRFVMAIENVPRLAQGLDNVWFIVSSAHHLMECDSDFQGWVGRRSLIQTAMLTEERADVFVQAINVLLDGMHECNHDFLRQRQSHLLEEDERGVPQVDEATVAAVQQQTQQSAQDFAQAKETAAWGFRSISLEWAEAHPAFTPRMVYQYVRRVAEAARCRAMQAAVAERPLEPLDAMPNEDDITTVNGLIACTRPGIIEWSG
jgi:hypothetical protein